MDDWKSILNDYARGLENLSRMLDDIPDIMDIQIQHLDQHLGEIQNILQLHQGK